MQCSAIKLCVAASRMRYAVAFHPVAAYSLANGTMHSRPKNSRIELKKLFVNMYKWLGTSHQSLGKLIIGHIALALKRRRRPCFRRPGYASAETSLKCAS